MKKKPSCSKRSGGSKSDGRWGGFCVYCSTDFMSLIKSLNQNQSQKCESYNYRDPKQCVFCNRI